MGLQGLQGLQVPVCSTECNLKAVALKETIGTIRVRETDAQGQASGRAGEEHAPASCSAWHQPRSARLRVRDQSDLPQFG
jgi:hypothetical protein